MPTNVVMFVCNGKIGTTIHRFTRTVMENTAMQDTVFDKSHLEQMRACPADITSILNEQARQAEVINRSQLSA